MYVVFEVGGVGLALSLDSVVITVHDLLPWGNEPWGKI